VSEQFTGLVTISDGQGREVFRFDSQFAVLDIGGIGNEGDLRILNAAGVTVFRFDATHSVLDLGPSAGGEGAEADLRIFGADGQVKIHLDGNTGDIRLIGADCAEEFDIESQEVAPGSVMTIGDGGRLRSCTEAYDRRVAGVVSGAGSLHSGIVMDSRHGRHRRTPVALTGKVYCRIDADYCPVEVGDLLTTSRTIGHAMKATDPTRAFGATIGKALQPLRAGTDLIPILVALQ
jgi:hypothetical protein